MCGRFTITLDASDLIDGLKIAETPPDWKPRYNAAPTQPMGVVADLTTRRMEWMRWGLIPFWAKDMSIGARMINARAETLLEKPSFKQAFQRRRCFIPADGFFEWEKSAGRKSPSIPHYFTLKGHEPFGFAGLWDAWKHPDGPEIRSFTIITTAANELVRPLHDRMPVILDKEACWKWLEGSQQALLTQMLRPFDPARMEEVAVGTAVNSAAYEAPDAIAPQARLF